MTGLIWRDAPTISAASLPITSLTSAPSTLSRSYFARPDTPADTDRPYRLWPWVGPAAHVSPTDPDDRLGAAIFREHDVSDSRILDRGGSRFGFYPCHGRSAARCSGQRLNSAAERARATGYGSRRTRVGCPLRSYARSESATVISGVNAAAKISRCPSSLQRRRRSGQQNYRIPPRPAAFRYRIRSLSCVSERGKPRSGPDDRSCSRPFV